MPSLPDSEIYLLVRTYFDDDIGWNAVRAEIEEGSEEGFFANVEYVDDRQFEGLSVDALEAAHPHRVDGWDVMYVADEQAVTHPAHPLLLVRVGSTEDAPFRCRAGLLYEVDANLSLANLDWDDFADQVDDTGVYGGLEPVDRPVHAADAAVAAYRSGSDQTVTISVPPDLWFEMQEDLQEATFGVAGQPKEVTAIAKDMSERLSVAPRMEIEDDVVVTQQAAAWLFIRERARRMQPTFRRLDGERRQVGDRIVALITHELDRDG